MITEPQHFLMEQKILRGRDTPVPPVFPDSWDARSRLRSIRLTGPLKIKTSK
jgi:hypothetical protein